MSRGDYVVSPMRHPARILASFKSRNRPITPADTKERIAHLPKDMRQMGMREGADFESQWKNLEHFMGKFDISFIHIDSPDRNVHVETFSKKIGRELTCDWPLTSNSGARCGNHDLEVTDEMISEIPDWIMDIYHGTC